LAALSLWLIAPAAPSPSRAQSPDGPLEYQVKAAVIYNFTKFIEWPQATSGPNGDSRFEMCLLGDREVLDLMRNTVRGKLVRGAAVEVREIANPSDAAGCELVFMTHPRDRRLSEALAASPDRVLTIAEAPELAASGAMINLVLEDGRVGFEIDIERANRAGFKISSNLLRLARAAESGARR
jgi:hypothetical protein